ncbi:MAG: peptidoglycan-binding protein [Myxococcaceae bacterium]|jgi:peptidoglycan hydrolase-like protein with peptidoglycan-binding domain|nr:peptidoglycan-binding protein [Myxococcaceae bacterium]
MSLDGVRSASLSSFPTDLGSIGSVQSPPSLPDVGAADDVGSKAGSLGFSGDSSFDAGARSLDTSRLFGSQLRAQPEARTSTADAAQETPAISAHRGASGFEPAAGTQAERRATKASSLERGAEGEKVRQMQDQLKRAGFDPGPVDGKFGPRTEKAVERFQRARGLEVDGIAGRKTFDALSTRTNGQTGTPGAQPVGDPATTGRGVNGEARIANQPRGPGMARGTITVNGNTYQFNSGSSRLFSTPQGTYRVTAHRNSRNDAGFVRDGVGFSFKMEDPRRPGSDKFYDPRAGRDRQYLRIHPDGGATGTAGCLGIVGDAATLRRFRADMNAELARNNGVYMLRVR